MKKLTLILLLSLIIPPGFSQDNYEIRTQNSSYILSGKKGESLYIEYFGKKLHDVASLDIQKYGLHKEVYPAFGVYGEEEKALHAIHADGNLSTVLQLVKIIKTKQSENVSTICFKMKDEVYPFWVNICYKSYFNEDIIETWTEIYHQEAGIVKLEKFASAYLPLKCFQPWLSHFHGNWGNEFHLFEEALQRGMKTIKNRDGVKNTDRDNPSFMLSLDGKATEMHGNVIAGSLAWTGNYSISFDRSLQNDLNVIAGMNGCGGGWLLEEDEVFQTPAMILSYSAEGKGKVSRNFHRWARKYKMLGGDTERPILLNSWEGVYMKIEEDVMFSMMDDFSSLGGELFVMDDGWFGNKYPRVNGSAGLGDWQPDQKKLPQGLKPLIEYARSRNLQFGIWIEPEMVNDKSELAQAHPEWIVHQANRETVKGRGNSQMLLDMSNPEVQDFVFGIVDKLLRENPDVAYIKWDANHMMTNYGSTFLHPDKQPHIQIAYHRGLQNTLERIRSIYPDIMIQVCASGGGRVNYGFLPYFHEFWTSDNTDPVSRIYSQWGTSHFYPAIAMASHVSASPNHQTNRQTPLKFRFDVAMSAKFGMEWIFSSFNREEKIFAKSAIQDYKLIRPIVQFGDLYRILSPYDDLGISTLMYVSEDKENAVFFAFNLDKNLKQAYPLLKFEGLDPDKTYSLEEINCKEKPGFYPDKDICTGEVLMQAGININMSKVYQSIVIKIKALD